MENKFKKIQEIILFNVARNLKPCSVDEIVELTGNTYSKKQVLNALSHLERRGLIIKKSEGKIFVYLNTKKIVKIKKVLGESFESNWEFEWSKYAI